MNTPPAHPDHQTTSPRWLIAAWVVCGAIAAAVVLVVVAPWRPGPPPRPPAEGDVPLGVEEAVIIRYGGPRLVARPYRRGASINVRIADEALRGDVRIYDVRYVVNLPGEFELTDYLTSADGRPIDDLPKFRVRGLTSLTKDIETRIREMEDVGVHIWHGYYETLAGLGVFWGLWLAGLIFVGRAKRPPPAKPEPPEPTLAERIARYLAALADRDLSVEEKARLELLLLTAWQERLDLNAQRMAAACRRIRQSNELGSAYEKLQRWLHAPANDVTTEELLRDLTAAAGNGHARAKDNRPQASPAS